MYNSSLSGENLGDVNLWGYEGPSSLAKKRKQIDELKMKINRISSKIDDQLKIDVIQQLRSLITDFTLLISDLHRKQLEEERNYVIWKRGETITKIARTNTNFQFPI